MELPVGVYGVELVTLLFLKGIPLTAVLLGGGLALRRASPRLRSAFWSCGLVALVLLPFLSLRLPALGSGPLPFPGSWVGSGTGAPSVGVWVALVWAGGALVFLGRLGWDFMATRLVGRAATPCRDPSVTAMLREGRRELGIRRPVRLRMSGSCPVPLTYGWLRPVILLPASAAGWPRTRLRAVLHHELSHVARHDVAAAVLVAVLRAVHWPNPLVWRLASRLRHDQELACDAAVARGVVEPATYARQLVGVARAVAGSGGGSAATLPMVRPSTLRDRVRFVLSLDEPDTGAGSGRRSAFVLGGLALLLALGIATASPWRPCEGGTAAAGATQDAGPAGPDAGPVASAVLETEFSAPVRPIHIPDLS